MTKKPKTKQIIYILTNEGMPGIIKIGRTTGSVDARLKQLDKTNIPYEFKTYHHGEVEDAQKDEKWLHELFSDKRTRDNREFFRMDPERAVLALKRIEIPRTKKIDADVPIATKTELKKRAIRSRFKFEEYGIKPGAEIYFSRDHSIKAEVLPNNKIKLDGKTTSLSESATKLLGYNQQVAGTQYWKYDGETLDERRARIDDENKKAGSSVAVEQSTESKTTSSRSFDFKKYGIEAGEEISYAHNESIKAKVLENNSIEYNGKETSLTAAAVELLGIRSKTAGPIHWKYKGEKLADRRKRMDERRRR